MASNVFSRLGFALNGTNYPSFCLKPLQVRSFEYILKGNDVAAIFPTGFGNRCCFNYCRISCRSRRKVTDYHCRFAIKFEKLESMPMSCNLFQKNGRFRKAYFQRVKKRVNIKIPVPPMTSRSWKAREKTLEVGKSKLYSHTQRLYSAIRDGRYWSPKCLKKTLLL